MIMSAIFGSSEKRRGALPLQLAGALNEAAIETPVKPLLHTPIRMHRRQQLQRGDCARTNLFAPREIRLPVTDDAHAVNAPNRHTVEPLGRIHAALGRQHQDRFAIRGTLIALVAPLLIDDQSQLDGAGTDHMDRAFPADTRATLGLAVVGSCAARSRMATDCAHHVAKSPHNHHFELLRVEQAQYSQVGHLGRDTVFEALPGSPGSGTRVRCSARADRQLRTPYDLLPDSRPRAAVPTFGHPEKIQKPAKIVKQTLNHQECCHILQ